MSADSPEMKQLLALALLFGLAEASHDDLAALTDELAELLSEGRIHAANDLGDLGPAVGFEPQA